MYNFNYHRPLSVDEAVGLIGGSSDGRLMAGGMTLIPTLKQRLADPADIVDLGSIEDLRRPPARRDGQLVVGAMTTHAEVASSDVVRGAIPALADLAETIGDPQVRNRGTLGGSIANNDPAADYSAGLLGLGATIRTNQGEYAADDFFTGMFETALQAGEVITEVAFPIPDKAAYAKFPNPASRYAIVGVFVSRGPAGTRVAVTGAGTCVFRVSAMEQALGTDFSADALSGISHPADELNEDIHAGADYRAHLIGVMARRAVAACG
jgi:carbon-monoxide dehydrogenase medium subunit